MARASCTVLYILGMYSIPQLLHREPVLAVFFGIFQCLSVFSSFLVCLLVVAVVACVMCSRYAGSSTVNWHTGAVTYKYLTERGCAG